MSNDWFRFAKKGVFRKDGNLLEKGNKEVYIAESGKNRSGGCLRSSEITKKQSRELICKYFIVYCTVSLGLESKKEYLS